MEEQIIVDAEKGRRETSKISISTELLHYLSRRLQRRRRHSEQTCNGDERG